MLGVKEEDLGAIGSLLEKEDVHAETDFSMKTQLHAKNVTLPVKHAKMHYLALA